MGKEIERATKDVASVATLGKSNYIKNKLMPDTPDLPDEPEGAPVADDDAIKTANRRKAAKRRSGGRAGTILTEGSKLG
jgi:hypothetical protein